MRVLTLTPFYPHTEDSAAGCFVAEPLSVLREMGFETPVIAARPFHQGAVRAISTAPSADWVRYLVVPGGLGLASAGSFLFARLFAMVRAMHASGPIDLIHAHAALPCGHAAALLANELRIPFVVTVHGLDAFFTNQVKGPPGRWCQKISAYVYRSARRVICISQQVRQRVLAGCHEASTDVVYNGVDVSLFKPALQSPRSSNLSVLSVGNLIPIKGHELLLRTIAQLHPTFPGVCCDIIGDGPEREHLESLSEQLNISGNIKFLGRKTRAEVADAMRKCTVFVLPSRYEGLGCVYLEAMACAKSVIACRGQGIEEIIQHGSNGVLVGTDDVEELGETMSLLFREPALREAIGNSGHATVLSSLTVQHQARLLQTMFQECLQ